MDVGDLFWADLPTTDGREQSGRRPVMVLQDDSYAARVPTVLIVPLTSSTTTTRYPGTVLIPATAANGLTSDSVLLVFQLKALDRKRFGSYIGAAEPAILAQVYQALDRLTGHP